VIAAVDASVVVKWFFPEPEKEPHVDRALRLLEGIRNGEVEPLQPAHWLAEVVAVIARLSPHIAPRAVDLLHALEFDEADEPAIYKTAAALASNLGEHLFDTLYHAVALEHDGLLVTADQRYFSRAKRLGHIVDLAEWTAK
jgi:predicted nucleic acid-binding protein